MLGICLIQEKNNKSIPKDCSTSFPQISYVFPLHKELSFFSISIKFTHSGFNMVNLKHSSNENHLGGPLIPNFKMTI